MSDQDLTLALRALGLRLDAEPGPDLAPAVLARLADDPAPAAAARRRWRPLVLALAVLLLVATVAVAASDDLRRWLRGSGVDIERVETLPPVASTPPPGTGVAFAGLGLGTPVTADAAATLLGAPLPASDELGPPDGVFSADTADGPAITLAWNPDAPVLLTIVPAHDENDPFLIGKSITQGTTTDFVSVPGSGDGVYLSGAPHAVTLFDGREVRFRLAQDVLLWRPPGDRVYRLEGRFDRRRAVELATSLQ